MTDTAIVGEFIGDAKCISVLGHLVLDIHAFLCVTEVAGTSTVTLL